MDNSGLLAVTANSPIPPKASVPAHVTEFVMAERVMAVSKIVKVSAVMLKANGHESLSARNRIGFMNTALGCHAGRVKSNGICVSQMNTLTSANIAPPTAANHA